MDFRGTEGGDVLTGTGDSDVIEGLGGDDSLAGQGGDDTLLGGDGADTLVGGEGDDQLQGGAGDDTYIWRRGDGSDSIYDESGTDTLVFGPDVALGEIQFGSDGIDFVYDTVSGATLYLEGGPLEAYRLWDGTVVDPAAHPYEDPTGERIDGTDGADTLTGTDRNDTLLGEQGDDVLEGGDGDDLINGGEGSDSLAGGLGDDTLYSGTSYYDPGNVDTLTGGAGADVFDLADTAHDVLITDFEVGDVLLADGQILSAEVVEGDLVVQTRLRYAVNEPFVRLEGVVGDFAYAGNRLTLVPSEVSGALTDGDDLVSGTNRADSIDLLGGNDTLTAAGGDDVAWGRAGDDEMSGGDGADTLHGGDGADRLEGQAGRDVLEGGGGNDYVLGGAGGDRIVLGGGDDIGLGEDGADTLVGGTGTDSLFGGAGDDLLRSGGAGNALFGGLGDDSAYGTGGDEIFAMGNGADLVAAGAGDDSIEGGVGGAGDTLIGGAGDDTIRTAFDTYGSEGGFAQVGDDLLTGGSGADWFFLSNIAEATHTITDLEVWDEVRLDDGLARGTPNEIVVGNEGGVTVVRLAYADGRTHDAVRVLNAWGAYEVTINEDGTGALAVGASPEASEFNDLLYGTDGADTITGGAGDDVIYGDGAPG